MNSVGFAQNKMHSDSNFIFALMSCRLWNMLVFIEIRKKSYALYQSMLKNSQNSDCQMFLMSHLTAAQG